VITIHDRLAAALRDLGVPAERLDVIPPGIDTEFWRPKSRPVNGQPTVIYAGNLDGYQDLPVLFQAMSRVAGKIPDARLLIATPNDPRQARKLADQHGAGPLTRVVHTPDSGATRRALHQASVAVCPRSSWSGFPIKNLNAQAAGLPVVACRGSAHGPEITVPDRDAAALAETLVSLLADAELTRSHGQAAMADVQQRFSLDKMLDGVEESWASLLAGR
jgi:glycosyltransferase involved in cell wall biosynthesis